MSQDRDISQVVRHLTTTFNNATMKLERPFRGGTLGANKTYKLQTEFAYLLNDLTQAPNCLVQKYITECNNFIDRVIIDLSKETSENTLES